NLNWVQGSFNHKTLRFCELWPTRWSALCLVTCSVNQNRSFIARKKYKKMQKMDSLPAFGPSEPAVRTLANKRLYHDHGLSVIVVSCSSFTSGTDCLPPPGQIISTLSGFISLPSPIVTGSSDCER